MQSNIRDKLTPLEAELRYSMASSFTYRQRRSLIPVIDTSTSAVEKDSVSIEKNCGADNICIPDLSLKVAMSEKSFLMGSTERINIEVEVDNNGEDSYESTLYMTVPSSLSYVSVDRLDTNRKVAVLCSPPTPSTNNTLRCDIGNPLPRFERVKFKLYFQPRYGSEVKSDYVFNIIVNSTNAEASEAARADNLKSISLPVRIQTDLSIRGASSPQPVRHNVSLYTQEKVEHERDIGPEVVHTYEIKCDGPSSIESANILILWPSYTLDGEHFLYLLEQPHTEGSITCDHVEDVNPLEVVISKSMRISSRNVGIDQEEASGTNAASSGSSSESSTFSNSSYEQSSSSSGGSYSQSSRTTYRERKTESRTVQGGDDLDDYIGGRAYGSHRDEDDPGRVFHESGASRSSWHSGYSSHPNNLYPNYQRNKRATKRDSNENWKKDTSCGPTKCIHIKCRIGELDAGQSVVVALRGRVWSRTLQSVSRFQMYSL